VSNCLLYRIFEFEVIGEDAGPQVMKDERVERAEKENTCQVYKTFFIANAAEKNIECL
jgi:hypothetical protein